MPVRLEKPWIPLEQPQIDKLPGQLGVFELADSAGVVIYVGFAGGRSQFGLRSELQAALKSPARKFRYEVNTAYRTRSRELLMAYFSDFGEYPQLNTQDETAGLGRLSLKA